MDAQGGTAGSTVVIIASPLERAFVDRIASVAPDRVDLVYRPDLLPPTTYLNDHTGPAGWSRSPGQEAEWRLLLHRADVLWDFVVADDTGPFELSPNLRWVQTTSAGVGPLVHKLGVSESDLIVTTASGVHAEALTEFVFAVLLYHEKRIGELRRLQDNRDWRRFCGGELAGKTIAIIGPGRIGRHTARIARAFGLRVHVMPRSFDPSRAEELSADEVFSHDRLHELLAGADYVVLSTPHTPDTAGLIGAAEIAAMKPGVVLINIARGAVIDEETMIEALRNGKIGFAGLDVFQTEPLPPHSPLWSLPNVSINPHSASTAPSENAKITDIFCRNLRLFLSGRYDEMAPLLDKRRMY